MTIDCLSIESFGGLENRTVTLGSGLNLVQGPNESGKSTLFAFIKFLLYGATRRSSDTELSERVRYMNWNAAYMGGSMTLSCDGRQYRVERKLTVSTVGERETARDVCRVLDLGSNEVCFRGEVPGEHFFGVPENVFTQTALMGQMSDGSVDGRDMGEAIENILFSGDESVNTDKALKKLDQARIALLHKNGNGGQLSDLNREISQLQEHLNIAMQTNSQIIALEGAVKAAEAARETNRKKLADCSRKCDLFEAMTRMRRFQLLHAHEARAAELAGEKTRLIAARGSHGQLPTSAWLTETKLLQKQVTEAAQETENLRRETVLLKGESGKIPELLAAARKLEAAGGREKVLTECHTRNRQKQKSTVAAAVLLPVAALLLAGGALTALTDFLPLPAGTVLPWILLAIGAVSAVAGICSWIAALRHKKNLMTVFSDFGVKDAVELDRKTAQWLEGQEEAKRREEELHRAQTRLSIREEQLAALRSQLQAALSEWVLVSMESEDDRVIAFCEKTMSQAEQLDIESYRQKTAIQNAQNELKGISEQETAAELEGIDIESLGEENITNLRRERDFTGQAIAQMDAKINEKSSSLAGLRATWNNPSWLAAQLDEKLELRKKLNDRLQALQLAYDMLDRAAAGLRGSIAPRLSQATAELTGILTGGKYDRVGVDPTLKVSYESSPSQTHSTEFMSTGTKTATYMALRIALVRLLFTRTAPPLVFDESLAHLDDDRAVRFLQLLQKLGDEGVQTILFSCHDREAALAARTGEFHLLRLEEKTDIKAEGQ